MAPTNKNKRLRYDDSDTDSDKERSYNSGNNWTWFLVVETLSEDLPQSIPSPFAAQKGFQAVAGTLKSIKNWAMGLFWWNVVGNRKWWVFSRPLDSLIDQHRFPSTKHQLITWHHLLPWAVRHDGDGNQNGTEETGCSWGPQGNVEERYWKGPTTTLFLTFSTPDLLKEVMVSYLKVKMALFVPSPMRCFNCKFGHTRQHRKIAAKCPGCKKDGHQGQCEGRKLCSNCNGPHAPSAEDCPVWQKEEIQNVCVQKHTRSQTVGWSKDADRDLWRRQDLHRYCLQQESFDLLNDRHL